MKPFRKSSGPSLADRFVAMASRPVRVLLVEDTENDRLLFRNFFQRFNVALTEATGRRDAVELAHAQPFDLALVDLRLPWEGNGVAVMLALRERSPLIPICAYSGQVSPQDIERTCEAVGVVTFAPKLLAMDEAYMRQMFVQFGLARRAGMLVEAVEEPKAVQFRLDRAVAFRLEPKTKPPGDEPRRPEG